MKACQGLFGKLFGHHFQPVFEQPMLPVTSMKQGGESAEGMAKIFAAMAGTKHVHTICTRCGAEPQGKGKP